MEKANVVNLNSNLLPLFSGTYENALWNVTEYDEAGEHEAEYDFDDYMKTIANAYDGEHVTKVVRESAPFVTSVKFYGKHWSPKYYNFNTDQVDFDVVYDRELLDNELKRLESVSEFDKWLEENFSSVDGFISFTPNSYEELYRVLQDESHKKFPQAFGTLVRYLVGEKTLREIEYETSCDWSESDYGGLKYTLEEERS